MQGHAVDDAAGSQHQHTSVEQQMHLLFIVGYSVFERTIQNSHREISMHYFDSWICFLRSEDGSRAVSQTFPPLVKLLCCQLPSVRVHAGCCFVML